MGLLLYCGFDCNTVNGNHHTAYVKIVDTSIIAATKNQLIWIKIHDINVFLITSIGFHFLSSKPTADSKFLKIAYKTKNHSAKLAIFFIIFHNDHNGASRCSHVPYTNELSKVIQHTNINGHKNTYAIFIISEAISLKFLIFVSASKTQSSAKQIDPDEKTIYHINNIIKTHTTLWNIFDVTIFFIKSNFIFLFLNHKEFIHTNYNVKFLLFKNL